MKIGIVGSRRRKSLFDRNLLFRVIAQVIKDLPNDETITLVSGGCREGADSFAEEISRAFEIPIIIHPVPTDPPIKHRGDYRDRAYARNELIAEDSDFMYALVAPDRTGGTENTLEHMRRMKKDFITIDENGKMTKNVYVVV